MKNKKIILKEKFVIPQIDEKYEGLKKTKPGFERSIAASPFFGSRVKDKIVVPDIKGQINVDKAYDSFRPKNEKHITDEQLIAQYGTKYYDFNILNENKRKQIYGTTYEEKPTTPEIKPVETVAEEENGINPEVPSEENDEMLKPRLHLDLSFAEEEEEEKEPLINPIPEYKTVAEEKTVENEPDFIDSNRDTFNKSRYEEYRLPPLSIFKRTNTLEYDVPDWLIERKEEINKVLSDFDVDGEVVNYTKGPAFTRYEIMLSSGVKVNKITALYENLQMALSAKSIRLLAPIPGKKTIGIEVPNQKTDTVFFGDIVNQAFVENGKQLQVSLGKNIDGEVIMRDISEMPHCLVAGATKSGKSVCMNTMLTSLLIKNKPDDLKLILIDPKKVEMSFYEELPHLVTPVINDPQMASLGLKWAVDEMERRYDLLSKARVRNLEDYNRKAHNKDLGLQKLPYIVIIIDELADLMMTCSSDVEDSIKRITQKARAAGIHLIVATQRPSVQVVSGNIKANIPTRIAFRVSSFTDSNTILDEAGAETLLGRGDMLIKDGDVPERVQGAYISDDEINAVCDYIREQGEPDYLFTHSDLEKQLESDRNGISIGGNKEFSEPDNVLYEVGRLCVENGSCSINLIQTTFNYGFNRSSRIVTLLEQRGVIGPKPGGTKSREVLVDINGLNRIFDREE